MPKGRTEAFSRAKIDVQLTNVGWKLTDGRSVHFEYTLAEALEDGDANTLAVVVDVAIRISRLALDVQRGQVPSAERLQEVIVSMNSGETSNVTALPSRAEPTKHGSILKQFDAILGGAKDKDGGKVH